MKYARLGIVLLHGALLAGCAALQNNPRQGFPNSSDTVSSTVGSADLRARPPVPTDDRAGQSNDQPGVPMLFPGSGPDPVAPASSDPASGQRVASAEPVAIRGDGVEMNFEGTDISAAAKALLGDILHLNFQIDPRVQGTITLASVGPVARKDVLPAFESALRMQNAAIVHDGGFLKIVPVSEAAAHTAISVGAGEPGFGVSVVPLRYVSATSAAKTAENLIARAGSIRVDEARNLLLVQGTESERQSAIDVISTFDVEWLRNQSVGVYPLKSTSPETMIADLERVFATREGGPGQGVIQFQPISRMNAVMVVTKNPEYLAQTTQWVQRLDRADTSGTMVRTYRLRYGNAAEVAKMVANIFGGDQASSANDSPANQIVPGVSTAESRLASLDRGSQNSNLTSQPNSAQGSTVGSPTPISAAFESFSSQKGDGNSNSKGQQQAGAFPFGGNGSHGVLEGVRITPDTVNNAILVYSNQEQYRIVERALRDVDRPRLSVAIDATVAEVTLTNQLQYGVQYFLSNNTGSISLFDAAQSIGSAVLSTTSPGFNAVLGSQANPKVVLNLLSSVTDVRVLSSPSIVALDNQPALLQVGDEVPVSTGTATVLTGANTPIVNQIQLVNTGVILKVLPHVNANGSIELEMDQEVSSVPNNGTAQTLTPTISQRRIHSTIAVMSGQTVLLGGLISDNTNSSRNGIPGLSDIKYLGGLFSTTDGSRTRSEIIVFVRPQLIRNSMDARAVTQEFRDRLYSMRNARSIVKGEDTSGRW